MADQETTRDPAPESAPQEENRVNQSRMRSVMAWIEMRLGAQEAIKHMADHPIPRNTASWWYVFGSGTMVLLGLQFVTGICLALVYTPAADQAYNSLEFLNYQQPLGWFLRGVHYWGSNLMLAMMTLHMLQVFLWGAYKFPRELTWLAGVALMLLTLGMAFTGQILRFDQNAYWGLGIGVSIMGRIPLIGPDLANVLMGGPIIGAETLTRFFSLHVFVIPGLLLLMLGIHLILVFRLGVNEWPMPGRLVNRKTYLKQYQQLLKKDGVTFFPHAVSKDMVFAGIVVLAVCACAMIFGPKGPDGPPDPTLLNANLKPDFYFLPVFAASSLAPEELETFLLLGLPPLVFLAVALVPFVFRGKEKSFRRRPLAVITSVVIIMTLFALALEGLRSPWSPHMDAWSGAPIPESDLAGRSPLALRGALVMQEKQCRNCHALGGLGGMRGPAFEGVGTRLTEDQLIRQVIQGGGNMPAYGKQLSPAQVTALVAYLTTLRDDLPAPTKPAL